MTVSVRIQTGGTEPVLVQVLNHVIGLTDLVVRVRRESDNQFLDFGGAPPNTFRAVPTQPNSSFLSQVNATNAPGLYTLTGGLDLSAITNMVANDTLHVIPIQTTGANAVLPSPGEIKVGQYVDNLDAKVSTRAAPGDEMDLTPAAVVIVATAVRDINLAATASGSLGEGVLIAKNSRLAYRIDNFVRNQLTGFADTARLRIFPDLTTAAASEAGAAPGADNEIVLANIAGTPDGKFAALPTDVVSGA